MDADREIDATAAAIAASLLPERHPTLQRVHGGGNNRIYRLTGTADQPDHALKLYAPPGADPVDAAGRLQREFAGLSFLARHLPGRVPQAIAADRARLAAIYEWIEGDRLPLTEASSRPAAHIGAMSAFVTDLHGLSRHPDARASITETAREACLSATDLLNQVERRLEALQTLTTEGNLQHFLATSFAPALTDARIRLDRWYDQAALSQADNLRLDRQILSPSDFGFHNALQRADGTLAFIDFEYFGWDDPVKLLADVVWHPGMRLSPAERQSFTRHCLDRLAGNDPELLGRYLAQLPLYGLRWAAIQLNEFFPERGRRRIFAGAAKASEVAWLAAKTRQLRAAQRYVGTVRAQIAQLQIVDPATKTADHAPALVLLEIIDRNQ